MRLSPNDNQNFSLYDAMAAAHFILGRYAEGLSWSKAALREQPDFVLAVCVAAANASRAESCRTADMIMKSDLTQSRHWELERAT